MSGVHTVCLGPHIIAQSPKTCNDFVGDEEHIVPFQDFLDLFEVAPGRGHHPPSTHERLGDESRDGLGSLPGVRRGFRV